MALTLRRRAAPEGFFDSSPRGEEHAASKISNSAPWRCFEALSGIRSRSPSARHSSANSVRHLRATLLPANYSEPPHELLLPAHQEDPATWQRELLSAIGAPASAQVFSARICPRLVVFWAIAPSSAEINERAGRLARISHIYGDALAVECDSNDSAFNECDNSETAQCKHIAAASPAAATASASTRAKISPPCPPASPSSPPLPHSPQTPLPSASSCRRSASLPSLTHPLPPALPLLPHRDALHSRVPGHSGPILPRLARSEPPSPPLLEPPLMPSTLDHALPSSLDTCEELSAPNLPSPPSLETPLTPSTPNPPPPPALCLASLLPYDVTERIFLALSFADLISCAAVCKAWRCHVSSNQHILLNVTITRPRVTFSSPVSPAPCPLPPLLVVRAAEAGNLDACVIMGSVMEARGEQQRALECAVDLLCSVLLLLGYVYLDVYTYVLGYVYLDVYTYVLGYVYLNVYTYVLGYVHLGVYTYMLGYVHLDGEGTPPRSVAIIRSLYLRLKLICSPPFSPMAAAAGVHVSGWGGHVHTVGVLYHLSKPTCTPLLTPLQLLLGYMYLDGEGTGKPSIEEAVRWYACHGMC
ncbi:unnamed protein product [Closterium sp. Yama58-4]|nr:unnamed protein product [Closterium sp. Yama58-4]